MIAAPEDERPRLAKQAAQFGEEDLTRFFQILVATDDDLRRKPDPRLHLELGLLKLINAQRLAPLEQILGDLRGGEASRPARTSGTPSRAATASSATQSAAIASPFSTSASSLAGTAAGMAPEPKAEAGPATISTTVAEPATASSSISGADEEPRISASPANAAAPAAAARPAAASPLPAPPPRIVSRAAEDPANGSGRRPSGGHQSGAARTGAKIFVVYGGARHAMGNRRRGAASFFSDRKPRTRRDVAGARPDGTIAHSSQSGGGRSRCACVLNWTRI